MPTVNYNELSRTYDDVRTGDFALVNRLSQILPPCVDLRVLDVGCGTGNYTDLFQRLTQTEVFGIDPSEGMLAVARRKNDHITFKLGQAENIPFENNFFDFIFMTDVIHHVPDIHVMFAEFWRVSKPGSKACIVTQSHQQIETRPIAGYFPGTVQVDKTRYPDIPKIQDAARSQGFEVQHETLPTESIVLDSRYLELVRIKGYSMLHLISETEYQAGLKALEMSQQGGSITVMPSGSTLVYVTKG